MNTDSANRLFDMAHRGLTSEIAKKQAELNLLRDQMSALLEDCPHTNTIHEESYTPGSYCDKAYTETWDRCICCGEKFNYDLNRHNYYG